MRWWILSVLIAVSAFASAPARAAVERECIVSVRVNNGWSTEQKRKVHFVTGLELARITRTLKVEFHQHYAVIWHGTGLPSVVRLDGALFGVGREFSDNDFLRLFEHESERQATGLEGEGLGLTWRIRARTAAGWVDPQLAVAAR